MPKIFISYRREDSTAITHRICERLRQRFGEDSVYIDVDNIPLGVDFRKHLHQAVANCDVLLVVIGVDWLTVDKEGQSRLNSPNDFVRIEIEAALARAIPVIPILAGHELMLRPDDLPPSLQDLTFRHAIHIDPGRDFNPHITRLIRGLEQLSGDKVNVEPTPAPPASLKEPDSAEIIHAVPTCFLFLLDRSGSTDEPIGDRRPYGRGRGIGGTKSEEIALAVNDWINAFLVRARRHPGIENAGSLAVIGYTTDHTGDPRIGSAFEGDLADLTRDRFAQLNQIRGYPLRIVRRNVTIYDANEDKTQTLPVELCDWINPIAEGGTPTCQVFTNALEMVNDWIHSDNHAECFPPIVINITDGEASDGDPEPYAASIRRLFTRRGNVLLFNCHLSMCAEDPIEFPGTEASCRDEQARSLFRMSSQLPASFVDSLNDEGVHLEPGARGFVYNADSASLLRFLDLCTCISRKIR